MELKKQFENEHFVLYAPNTLKELALEMIDCANERIDAIFKFFKIDNFRKVQINLFDDKIEFRNFIFSLREEDSLPEYAAGTYDKGMINICINLNGKIFKNTISHELCHIIYQELILKGDYSKRIVWLDEGLAQLLSGEMDMSDAEFNAYFNDVLKNTKQIPDINNLKHGKSFRNELYNGYDLSYLCVKYLFETLGYKKLYKIINSNEEILNLGNNVLSRMFEYYKVIV